MHESSTEWLPALHLCEVPPEMYPAREALACKWRGTQTRFGVPKPKKATAKKKPKKATSKTKKK